jgi:hypothetical protein
MLSPSQEVAATVGFASWLAVVANVIKIAEA